MNPLNVPLIYLDIKLTDLSAMAVAVFDHGAAPADISDRKFRFDYLDERIKQENSLSAFAYTRHDIPASMTRLQSVAASAINVETPLVVMDTAPAAILGSLYDPQVRDIPQKIYCKYRQLPHPGLSPGTRWN